MSASSDQDSHADRLLYSPHKALDAVLELGAVPRRLFWVFYPIWRVEVEGRQRVATDFKEIEWFIERGIQEAGLTSVADLADFYGLAPRFVEKLVSFLRGIGHIRGTSGGLSLTELGIASVNDRVVYEEEETAAKLYFDGLESQPLTREHYRIPIYEDIAPHTGFRALYQFDRRWDRDALEHLMSQADRQKYNLPDEVTQVTLLDREPAYMPVYIVERCEEAMENLPLLLVFSRIQSTRDEVLERAVNVNPLARGLLYTARAGDLELTIKKFLGRRGLSQHDWHLQHKGRWGAQVKVDAQVLAPADRAVEPGQGLTVRDVGRYLLIYDWCVWLTCDDPGIRRRAGAEHLLEWLQYVARQPTSKELVCRLALMQERLATDPFSVDELMDAAQKRGLARAMECLDTLETDDLM